MENTTNASNIITVTDIALCKQIIDLASSRGAFKGDELRTVGEVYEKLSLFLTKISEEMAAQQAAQSESSASEPAQQDQTQGE